MLDDHKEQISNIFENYSKMSSERGSFFNLELMDNVHVTTYRRLLAFLIENDLVNDLEERQKSFEQELLEMQEKIGTSKRKT